MAESIDMAPIVEALRTELQAGKRVIHLWDGGHELAAPRQILASPELFDLAKQYGHPVYVVEEVNPENTAEQYKTFTKDDLNFQRTSNDGTYRMQSVAAIAERVQRGEADIYYPDARRPLNNLTDVESSAYAQINSILSQYAPQEYSQKRTEFLSHQKPEIQAIVASADKKFKS
jgi:hypothetical protein